ncbi:MAG TPA: ABC transporter substrate-binding protein [Bradyrhizobium sp.]|uniref:ABC transporter substrate-binding protein n=1 Tax=Bradyrhizobium sp. TaxID=376 RepID=UPI002C5DC858|nr:ABC transporter substrate-binding protein [Bradyrhizobium sp.]HTA99746.1 ABC transporter substrate-binding protein [Bradyrhizobium sp.]
MRRRKFIKLMCGAAVAWPVTARAQQSAMPVIGFLNAASPDSYARMVAAFRQGLKEAGYVEGQNVAIEFRWAEGRNDRLPAMAADLVRRQVAVIAATSTPAALVAKAATTTIPIVFEMGGDPVLLGLVSSLNHPGGNVTGVTQLNVEVAPKRLELLHELVPTAGVMALLVNPDEPALAEPITRELQTAAHTLGLDLRVLDASTERELDAALAKLIELRVGGLVISPDVLFISRIEQLAAWTLRHAVPAIAQWREFAIAGGLLSYGAHIMDAYRLAGSYTGWILKGQKPGDLPVQQLTKIQLVINLKTAKALGISVPLALSGRADEVIE